jgi:hypothetical protein
MANALNRRPADGTAERLVAKCCGRREHKGINSDEEEDEEGDQEEDEDDVHGLVPVMLNHGLYFLAGLSQDEGCGAIRLTRALTAPNEALGFFYQSSSLAEIQMNFNVTTSRRPKGYNTKRIPKRFKEKADIRKYVPSEEMVNPGFDLSDMGIALAEVARATGPDILPLDDMTSIAPDNGYDMTDLNTHLSVIMNGLPLAVFTQGPNNKAAHKPAHLLWNETQRTSATLETLKHTDFTGIFSRIVFKVLSAKEWQGMHFDRYFPPKGRELPASLQNFPTCPYFVAWRELMESTTPEDSVTIRKQVLKQFVKLHWLPLAESDRMWNTRRKVKAGFIHLPRDTNEPTVILAINGMQTSAENVVLRQQLSAVDDSDAREELGVGEVAEGEPE